MFDQCRSVYGASRDSNRRILARELDIPQRNAATALLLLFNLEQRSRRKGLGCVGRATLCLHTAKDTFLCPFVLVETFLRETRYRGEKTPSLCLKMAYIDSKHFILMRLLQVINVDRPMKWLELAAR